MADSVGSYNVAWITPLALERAAAEAMFDREHDDPPVDFRKSAGDILIAWQLGDPFDSDIGKGELARTAAQIRSACQQVPGESPCLSRKKLINVRLEMAQEMARPHGTATPPADQDSVLYNVYKAVRYRARSSGIDFEPAPK
jgi:hypothetical protein